MFIHAVLLGLSFLLILAGSEAFTNGVEWAGERLGIAEAAVGSLLAAIGTALPETFIPVMALLMGRSRTDEHSAVGVGAIIGAPLMLSTVALLVMGVACIVFRRRRKQIALIVSREDARRDLAFFLPVFTALLVLGYIHPAPMVRYITIGLLLLIYSIYTVLMLRIARKAESVVEHELHLEKILSGNALNPRTAVIWIQVVGGVLTIILGARVFVDQIVLFANYVGVNAGVLSLILSPLATELPEKFNSVVWIRQRKDHLALANITGAMVFQSCIPVALGLAFTSWRLSHAELVGGTVALASAALLYINLRDGKLGTPTLMLGGVAYAAFILILAFAGLFH
ncbi:MAG: sodium:calcium antiporter [Candidatus Binataceae bacterium]|nr:sodium:calcium antiporter [Candidatus Binataceae bacterium]